jgi:uncharacterized protein (DUF302 family)
MIIDRPERGIVKIPSKHSVDETMDRLKDILKSKQITLFVLTDHSGEGAKVAQKGVSSNASRSQQRFSLSEF